MSSAIEQALAALEPFAATGAVLDPKPKDDAVWAGQRPAPPITFGHLRRAREAHAALTAMGEEPRKMGKLEELTAYIEADKTNGLLEICFTAGSDAEVTTEEAAAVALAMLRYKHEQKDPAPDLDALKEAVARVIDPLASWNGVGWKHGYDSHEEAHEAVRRRQAGAIAKAAEILALIYPEARNGL